MADLRRMRKRFTIAAGVLAGISAVAIVYLLVPLGSSNPELYAELDQARKELKIKEAQAAPLRGLPEKLVKTHEDILNFYRDRLPQRQSAVSEELGKLASSNGVALSDVKYENFDTDIPDLQAVVVDAQLSGDYAKIAHFINAVERDKTFLIVDGLTLDDQKAGAVRLQLRFETYVQPAYVRLLAPEPAAKPADSKSKTKDSKAGG